DVLAADAQAEERWRRGLLAGPAGATLDERLHAAEARGVDDHPNPRAHGLRRLRTPPGLEGHDRPEAAHLTGGEIVARGVGAARVAHADGPRMIGEAAGDHGRARLCALPGSRER